MPEETKKKSSKKKWLYAGGALAGLAALGALAAWLLGRKRSLPVSEDEVAKAHYGLPSGANIGDVQRLAEEWGFFDRNYVASDDELRTLAQAAGMPDVDPDTLRAMLNLPSEQTKVYDLLNLIRGTLSAGGLAGSSLIKTLGDLMPNIHEYLQIPEKVPIRPKPKE